MTVAPEAARAAEGETGTHRSSQISTPRVKSGSWRHCIRMRLPKGTSSSSREMVRGIRGPGVKWRAS